MLSECESDEQGAESSGGVVLPESVLIAEDEHLVASELVDQLQKLNVHVIGPASNGQTAIDLAQKDRPAMALIDIRMPEIDGLEVAARMNRQGIPVVIISAYSDDEYLTRSTQAGVFGYLIKPVAAEELRSTLAVAWARFNQQTQLEQEVQKLKTALEERKLIERAKGLLMDKLQLSENDAMRRLQKQARGARRTLADMARAVLESNQMFDK